ERSSVPRYRCVTRVCLLLLLAGCAEELVECVRPDTPPPRVELSAVEAPPSCQPMDAVEIRSGEHEPTSHDQLRAYAADRGANYVVLDAFGVVYSEDDIIAVTRARLFRCPSVMTSYFRPR